MTLVGDVQETLHRLDEAAALGAVVARDDAAAMAAAEALEASNGATPLAGRAITVKDWIDVAGLPCEGESPERTGRVPERDATAVARLREAGAVVVAKTQPGADHPIHGACLHPLDTNRTPGATSSGEAALLAAGATSLGLGSDSGGSIRLPAAWCGVFGFKPSFGLVPLTGHFPRVGDRHDGRTVIGPMATSVDDLWPVLAEMAGPDGLDPSCAPVPLGLPDSVDVAGLRVATLSEADLGLAAPTTQSATRRALDALARLGCRIVDQPLPTHLEESLDITTRYWRRSSLTGAEADRQLFDWDRFAIRQFRAMAEIDVVIGPTVADVAPLRRPLTGDDYVFTLGWSLTGAPAISIPAGDDPTTGLPLAVQVAAHRWNDHVAFAVARALGASGVA